MLSSDLIESTRAQALAFVKADPEHFDLVFVANATAAIKLVMSCFPTIAEKQLPGTAITWTLIHPSLVSGRLSV